MEGRNGNEISSFFPFEASGDSELADSNNRGDSEAKSCNLLASIEGEDDAESCNCDSSETFGFGELQDCDDQDFNRLGEDDNMEECNNCKHAPIHQMRGLLKGPIGSREEIEEEYSRDGGVDGSGEIMNDEDEMERNKLFWETCMQVGYP